MTEIGLFDVVGSVNCPGKLRKRVQSVEESKDFLTDSLAGKKQPCFWNDVLVVHVIPAGLGDDMLVDELSYLQR